MNSALEFVQLDVKELYWAQQNENQMTNEHQSFSHMLPYCFALIKEEHGSVQVLQGSIILPLQRYTGCLLMNTTKVFA